MYKEKRINAYLRDERNRILSHERKQAREDLYLKLTVFLFEQNRGILLEDRKKVVLMITHKLNEQLNKERTLEVNNDNKCSTV